MVDSFTYQPFHGRAKIHRYPQLSEQRPEIRMRICQITYTLQFFIREEIKRLNSGNACYHSVQKLLFLRLLSKNVKIRICNIQFRIWLCNLVFDIKEEHRLRVFESRVLRIFGPKRDEVAGRCNKMHNEEFHDLYSSPSTFIKMR
jgi:hypothetical protein